MARTPDPSDPRLLARVTARVLQNGAEALYRDAALFDRLYQRRRRDVAFYVKAAERYGGPVLELGVGSGRVALAIARAGVDVVGVDTMPSMLEAAEARRRKLPRAAAARLTLVRGDLRTVRLRRRFPLVIAPFNTLLHLYSRADLERALGTCRQHLTPRGRLVFDVVMPDLRALVQDPERLYACPPLRHPTDGTRYRLLEASHYDPLQQIRSVTMVLQAVVDGRGTRPSRPAGKAVGAPPTREARSAHSSLARDRPGPRSVIPLVQRQLFPAELEALLHYNGFAVEARYGDFDGSPPAADSEVQIVVARKRGRR